MNDSDFDLMVQEMKADMKADREMVEFKAKIAELETLNKALVQYSIDLARSNDAARQAVENYKNCMSVKNQHDLFKILETPRVFPV